MHIELVGVSKRYGGVAALDNVSLEIAPGQIVAVVGANGAGKTTLLRCLAAIAAPNSGQILYDGERFERGRLDLRRRLMFLPDVPCYFREMTVLRHIGMALRLYGIERPELAEFVVEALADFDLLPLAESQLRRISRGKSLRPLWWRCWRSIRNCGCSMNRWPPAWTRTLWRPFVAGHVRPPSGAAR